MAKHANNFSILDQLKGFEWSNEESVAFEVALEAINGAVGAYSALIAWEESKIVPDLKIIAMARTAQANLARQRVTLEPSNPMQVAAIRRHCVQIAEEVRRKSG